jgi:hypothetical protein
MNPTIATTSSLTIISGLAVASEFAGDEAND